MSVLQKLTEGITHRDLQKEGAALLDKWERTGLLEGIENDRSRQTMSVLLENQAKELLREASTMSAGDVEGFASVAFPIVRRVFGSLIANELVSVQPMSLPSGLIFFLDFQVGSNKNSDTSRLGYDLNDSLYGGGVVGSEVTGGVSLTGANAEKGPYNLNNAFTSPTSSVSASQFVAGTTRGTCASGAYGGAAPTAALSGDCATALATALGDKDNTAAGFMQLCRFDPDLTSGAVATGTGVVWGWTTLLSLTSSNGSAFNRDNAVAFTVSSSQGAGKVSDGSNNWTQLRRLTHIVKDASNVEYLLYAFGFEGASQAEINALRLELITPTDAAHDYQFPIKDDINEKSSGVGAVVGSTDWGLEAEENIPEIDIKVDSIPITAVTKKLKAKWSPELGQDLNAYHNLDAEVELTSILSEQIALEIDREILEDLIKGATAGTYYWSRSPGMFLNRTTGAEVGAQALAPDFTGTVSEWYETLIETINDVSAQIHRKTLRGGANFLVCGPEVANLLEFTSGFRASITADVPKGTVGAVKAGAVNKKWDVYVDPYFPRNVVLVGRKGASFLESGYVYSPYVPLQVTPTIFGPEDFVPRKGVLTRYGKKMVRPDMYGLVIVRGLLGESGG